MAHPTPDSLGDAEAQRIQEATLRVLAESGVEVRHEPTDATLRRVPR
jgi:trimethylamine:corrinoid methyltransferase-like protein